MQGLINFLSQPWTWYASGAAITLVLFLLNWMGRSFGVSSTFKNLCTVAGAGKSNDFFKEDFSAFRWRLFFVGGAIIGGYIGATLLASPEPVQISAATVSNLSQLGIDYPTTTEQGTGMIPTDLFSLSNPLGIILALIGGFLVGFGARYAGGCTSGHAITGMAHFQLPSLITVVGFFIGGLIMTWGVLPIILG